MRKESRDTKASKTLNLDDPIEKMTKAQLLEVLRLFSRNWITLDGLWFTLVEDTFGLEAALDLDLKMWERHALIEARRIKTHLGIEGGGVSGVLKALRFMTFDIAMPFSYSLEGPDEAALWITTCKPQEARLRAGRGEFPCKEVGRACYGTVAGVIDPKVSAECVFCPPDRHPPDVWCKWKLTRYE